MVKKEIIHGTDCIAYGELYARSIVRNSRIFPGDLPERVADPAYADLAGRIREHAATAGYLSKTVLEEKGQNPHS